MTWRGTHGIYAAVAKAGEGFGLPVQISNSWSENVELGMDLDGNVFVVWSKWTGSGSLYEIFGSKYDAVTATWSAPNKIWGQGLSGEYFFFRVPNKFDIAPVVKGPGGIFPTIFSVLREQQPKAVVGVFHDWGDYGRLFERNMVDVIENPKGPTNTVERAVEFIKSRRPAFTFIHLDHVDHAGHETGHGTPAYYASVAVADKLIGEVISAFEEAGMKESTLLLVTSDHGGKAKGHGGATMEEIEIPWIITGPGVRVGHEIKSSVNTYDTAATIAFAFGL